MDVFSTNKSWFMEARKEHRPECCKREVLAMLLASFMTTGTHFASPIKVTDWPK